MVLNRFRDLNVKSVLIAGWVENYTAVYAAVQDIAPHSDNLVPILGRMCRDIADTDFHCG